VLVLNYHGVVDRASVTGHLSFIFGDLRDFDSQMALLARRAAPLSAEELEHALAAGVALPDAAVHVTFDDGHANTLQAAEVLDHHGIPWSLFVVVDAVLDGYRPWFVRLADAIDGSTNVMLPSGNVFEMSSNDRRRAFARLAKSRVMAAPNQDTAVDEIVSWPGMRVTEDSNWRFLDSQALRELAGAGVSIGNHSATHRNLVRCSDHELASEVSGARHRVEGELGSPVRHFAYPGRPHNPRVRSTVGVDHTIGFATWTLRSPLDRFAVRRYEPGNETDLRRILARSEPWYGERWLRWNGPSRVKEVRHRIRDLY